MLDIELFRTNLEKILESENKRFKDPNNAEKVIEFDKKWRQTLQELEESRKNRNEISVKIGEYKKTGEKEKAEKAINDSKILKDKIDELEKEKSDYFEQREIYRYMVGNILHDSVPIAQTEEGNKIIREGGTKPRFSFKPLNHVELVEVTDCADTKKASEIAGSRFYYLKGDLVQLNLALMKFALDIMQEKGYTPMWTPFFVKHEIIKAAAELSDFEDTLYKIQGEDLYMIATSEQTIAAFHYNEILDPELLPLKYAGVS